MSVKIDIPKKKIAEFCRHNRIRRLAFFRSVLRDNFGPNSNADVLVEFEPGARAVGHSLLGSKGDDDDS